MRDITHPLLLGKERKVAKLMIHNELQGEEVPFSFLTKGDEEMRTSALVSGGPPSTSSG